MCSSAAAESPAPESHTRAVKGQRRAHHTCEPTACAACGATLAASMSKLERNGTRQAVAGGSVEWCLLEAQSARYPAGNHALDVWVDCMGSARGWHACAALPSREACRTNPMHSVDLSNNLRPCICTMDLHKLHMASLKSRKGLLGCIKICTQSVGREATRSTELCLSLSRCVPT